MTAFAPDRVDAVIFDLGGVIVDLDFERTVRAFTELLGRDASSLYTQVHQVELFDLYERGEKSSADFRHGLVALFGGSVAPADDVLDAAWNALLGRIPEEKLTLLAALGRSRPLYLLSNTNEIHLGRFLLDYETEHAARFGPWSGLFARTYYSHEMGMRKPEPRIFQTLLTTHGLAAERTLFIDDNAANIAAARELGLLTHLHVTNAPLAPYFQSYGL